MNAPAPTTEAPSTESATWVPLKWLDISTFLRGNPNVCIVCYERNEQHEQSFAAHACCYDMLLPYEQQYIDFMRENRENPAQRGKDADALTRAP